MSDKDDEVKPEDLKPREGVPVIAFPKLGLMQNADQKFLSIVLTDDDHVPQAICQMNEATSRELIKALEVAVRNVFSGRLFTFNNN